MYLAVEPIHSFICSFTYLSVIRRESMMPCDRSESLAYETDMETAVRELTDLVGMEATHKMI